MRIQGIFTSMFWFNKPEIVSDEVKTFLEFEKEWLYGTWDIKKILLIITVPFSFAFLAVAFWKRNLIFGLLVLILIATGKITWSILNAGKSGETVIIPAIIGLILYIGLIFLE